MNLIKKAVTTLGGIFLAALLIAALAPKATHGLVAALVQVVPGTTTHVGQNESQLVSLGCYGGVTYCETLGLNGVPSGTAYVVPSGYTLIVTDYQWSSTGVSAPGVLAADFFYDSATLSGFNDSQALADKSGNVFAHEHYATGIRVGSGITIVDNLAVAGLGGSQILGYLVPND